MSPQLLPERITELLAALPLALQDLFGDSEGVLAYYGWGANLHIDLCWKPMEVRTNWLDQFIEDSLDPEIIVPGQADFIFEVRGGALEVEFCHEAHIHVSGTDDSLVRKFLGTPPFSGVVMQVTSANAPDDVSATGAPDA